MLRPFGLPLFSLVEDTGDSLTARDFSGIEDERWRQHSRQRVIGMCSKKPGNKPSSQRSALAGRPNLPSGLSLLSFRRENLFAIGLVGITIIELRGIWALIKKPTIEEIAQVKIGPGVTITTPFSCEMKR